MGKFISKGNAMISSPRRFSFILDAVLVVLALSSLGRAQQSVTVHFLDFRSGKPVASIEVGSILWNGTSLVAAIRDKRVVLQTNTRTTKEGVMTVPVPFPTPEHLTISSLDTVNPVQAELSVAEILKAGAIVPYRRGTSDLRPQVKPGEVVILTQKLTAANRVAREVP